jgi:hypothetical protein
VEKLGIAVIAIGCAIAIALWVYGVYCYVQMVRNRVPGTSPLQVAWSSAQLTPRGLEFRRRALRAYLWFAVVAVLLLLVSAVFARLLPSTPRGATLP